MNEATDTTRPNREHGSAANRCSAADVPIANGHPEATCDDCGGKNVIWFAPSEMWNKVARRPDGEPMLCPRCFILRAEAMGIHEVWMVTPDLRDTQTNPPNGSDERAAPSDGEKP